MVRAIAVFLSCVLLFGEAAFGSSIKKIRNSAVTAALVAQEIKKGKRIIESGKTRDILHDPYLISALYYSNNFFARIRRHSNAHSPQNRIMLGLAPLITSDFREEYLAQLEELSSAETGKSVTPLDSYHLGECLRRCHKDAIDLFTEEGSTVRSITWGIVVLGEEGWRSSHPFATTSRKGGNEVIIFSPATKEFYRYCHLGDISVHDGNIVRAGDAIGTVGHTGLNASRKNHGKHLHLEINKYDSFTHAISPRSARELNEFLESLRPR